MQNTLTSGSTAPLARLARWWHEPSIQIPLIIVLVARFLTLLTGVVALRAGPVTNVWSSDPIFVQSLQARQFDSPLTPLIEPWHRWDTGWYLKIAVKGYAADDGTIIFQPLYPLSMALVGAVVGDKLLAGLLVSTVACFIFLIVFYRLIRLDWNSNALATNTLVLLVTIPVAFYMQAAYTESLFLALTAGTMLAARHRRWWLTALLAALATLTRLQGWVLFFPITWMAFLETPRFWQAEGITWAARIRQAIPRLFAMGTGPLMIIAFQGGLWLAGLGSVTVAYEKYWALAVKPPWAPVIDVIGRILAGTAKATEIAGFIAFILIVALLLLSIRRLPIFYQLYLWPTLVLILLRYYTPTLLNGTLRYMLDFFPIFITVALLLGSHRQWRLLYVIVGITLQFFAVYLFARWMWIA